MSRTVVVAGVGPGLGSSVAREFAAQGDSVALFARSESYLAAVARDVTASTSGEAIAVPTDLSDPDAVRDGFETVRDRVGPTDVLVLTVSSPSADGGILDVTAADLEATWAVRVAGQFRCAKEATTDMADGDGGTILFTTSGQAVTPGGDLTYSTARHAVRGMARSMAADETLGANGVETVHVVVDGWIAKPELRDEFPDHDRWMDPDEMAVVYRRLADGAETVHASEIDLRHPRDGLSF